MRILQIVSYMYPAWGYGGPGKLVYELSNQLASTGHHVAVYTTDAYDQRRRRNRSDNPFTENPTLSVFPNLSNVLAYRYKAFLAPSAFFTLSRHVEQFDAVHIHEIFTPLAAAAARACKKNGVPLFVSAHGTLSGFHLKHRSIAKDIFFRLFGNDFRSAAGFIAATQEEEKEYQQFGIDLSRIYQVPNGINTSAFERLPARGLFRAAYNIPPAAYILLYIGRINSLKGLDMLVEVFSRIRGSIPTKLVIGGTDDGYLDTLKLKIHRLRMENEVVFPGMVAGEKKLQALADADVFVYPSPAEGFSLAILEAGASGLPLVITKGCKFPEVERSGAGRITDASVEALIRGIRSLLDNPSKLKPVGAAAKRLIQTDYSITHMAHHLGKLYQKRTI